MHCVKDCVKRQYVTRGGIEVLREQTVVDGGAAIEAMIDALDERRGGVFTSTTEIPGRYARWDRGFVDPPLAIEAHGRCVAFFGVGDRGRLLLDFLAPALARSPGCRLVAGLAASGELHVAIDPPAGSFSEEERSRQPSVFSALRTVLDLFGHDGDPDLGLYGAFGYDLAFQFEPIPLRCEREADQRDLVLYLPDELVVVDHRREHALKIRYEFSRDGRGTAGLPRTGTHLSGHVGPPGFHRFSTEVHR